MDETNKTPTKDDLVSYRRRQYKVRVVWGERSGNAGMISISENSSSPHGSGLEVPAKRLVWSNTRWGGCWIFVKP